MAPAEITVVVVGSGPREIDPVLFLALEPALDRGSLELVVASNRDDDLLTAERRGARVVYCPAGSTVPRRRSAGLAAASASIVAMTEGFCVPTHDWVDAILDAHRRVEALAVGGPVSRTDGGATDWASTLFEYGRFPAQGPARFVSDLPAVNIAYDLGRLRAVLGGIPEEFMEFEVHGLARRQGERFWYEPKAVMCDRSRHRLGAATAGQYHHGRLFGGKRLAGRHVVERLVRFALAPAIPLLLLARIARSVVGARHGFNLVKSMLELIALAGAWTLGEAVGVLFGVGKSGARWT